MGYEFLGEKIIFPSAPVSGIDNDQSLTVLTLHIVYNFSLEVSLPLSPLFIINHPETANCCNFLFVFTFVGDFGRELSCKHAARL